MNEAGLSTEILDGRVFQYTAGSGQIDVYDPQATPPERIIALPEEQMTLSVSPSQNTIAGFALHDDGLRLVSVYLITGDYFVESMFYRTDGFDQPVELVMTAWDASGSVARFYVTDGLTLIAFPFAHPDGISSATLDYEDRSAVEAGITPTELLGAFDDQLFLYHPMGRNILTNTEAIDRGEMQRGIFVIDANTGKQLAHLQPNLAIADGTVSGDYLYAIAAPEGEGNAELVQIDIHTGDVRDTKTLTRDIWTAAIVRLNAEAVRALGKTGSQLACADPAL